MLGNIWKAHDSSPWQNNFINEIQIHNQSPWFKPMAIYSSKSPILIGNIKTQFSLALLYQKEKESKIINAWQRKNIMVKCYRGNHLMKKLIESYLEDYVLVL